MIDPKVLAGAVEYMKNNPTYAKLDENSMVYWKGEVYTLAEWVQIPEIRKALN